mmetsp:Transcript_29361/g.95843  ORF Transcript_29361/g.95843 Transcript_29361/m.95843 type:complete len:222 (-) Transcript_29361:194-859(-)
MIVPVTSSASSRKWVATGYARPGMCKHGAPQKYSANKSAFSVALMSTTLSPGRRPDASSFLSRQSRKSVSSPRSCTSSTNTCDTPRSVGSHCRRRSRTPVVQKSSRVLGLRRLSSRIWYPTMSPRRSPRSAATRSATVTAARRRGCVHTMFTSAPRPARHASCSTRLATCVVLPAPVSADTMLTWPLWMVRSTSSRIWYAGSCSRCASIALYLGDCRRSSA